MIVNIIPNSIRANNNFKEIKIKFNNYQQIFLPKNQWKPTLKATRE